jgi:hypothetical protein
MLKQVARVTRTTTSNPTEFREMACQGSAIAHRDSKTALHPKNDCAAIAPRIFGSPIVLSSIGNSNFHSCKGTTLLH